LVGVGGWCSAGVAPKFCVLRYSAPIGAQSAILDRRFFALSDPTRRSILERLATGPATIGELARPFDLTLNGVKKHVVILESVDLVITAKVGRSRECRLGPAQLDDATRWIEDYRRAWERRLDRFGAYVEQR
jgi:DNA-binding transcriptional ArsR family regulator